MMNKEVTWISHANPYSFPSCPVMSWANGQVLMAQCKATLLLHINGTRLCKHLQNSRKGWNNQVWASIEDFSCLGGALLSMPITYHLKLSKLLHGWLNTGHQRKKMEPLALSKCPVCNLEDKTRATTAYSSMFGRFDESGKVQCYHKIAFPYSNQAWILYHMDRNTAF